jgi:hypothetical protein
MLPADDGCACLRRLPSKLEHRLEINFVELRYRSVAVEYEDLERMRRGDDSVPE